MTPIALGSSGQRSRTSKTNGLRQIQRENIPGIAAVSGVVVAKTTSAGLMQSADIGLQVLANFPAFYYGTSPNKFFDYVASGLPVLCNYPGWIAELINEFKCGYAVPPEDPSAFADALIWAADSSNQLKDQGGNALTLARGRFDRLILSRTFVEWLQGASH
jgi:glycosyltransferase involved in cell wall biosynthesis